jgi:hypothetical protein
MGLFDVFLGNLNQMGFFQFLLPFLLILAIVYGVIRFAAPEKFDKSAAGLISIIIAFFFMNYSGGAGVAVANFFTSIFGATGIILTGILVVVLLLGLMGIKFSGEGGLTTGNKGKWIFAGAAIFIGFLVFLGAGGVMDFPTNILGVAGDDVATIVFFVVILAIALWWLGREEGSAPAAS